MSTASLYDDYRNSTNVVAKRRRFGPATIEERHFEVKALRAELRNLQRSNDDLSSQTEGRSLEFLVASIGRAAMDENCRRVRDNLARMSAIFVRIEELRRLGFV